MGTWVQTVAAEDVDLETIAANHNTIKVNDVNDGHQRKDCGSLDQQQQCCQRSHTESRGDGRNYSEFHQQSRLYRIVHQK